MNFPDIALLSPCSITDQSFQFTSTLCTKHILLGRLRNFDLSAIFSYSSFFKKKKTYGPKEDDLFFNSVGLTVLLMFIALGMASRTNSADLV